MNFKGGILMRQSRIDGEGNRDLCSLPKMISLDADNLTYQMLPSDNVLFVDTSGYDTDDKMIVTLPSLSEAVGQFYFVKAPLCGTHGDVSLYEKETGADLATYGDLDTDNDHVLLFCTGQAWLMIFDGVA